jgi:hypothetical protein
VIVVLNFGRDAARVRIPGESVERTDLVSGASVAGDGGLVVDSVAVLRAER